MANHVPYPVDCNAGKITYPPEWADRDRMSYLLAPFPPSDKPLDLNDPKFSFWSSLILSSSKELRRPVTSPRELQERLRWNGQVSPGCLNLVLEGMERVGEVMKTSDFYRVEQGWLSWGADVVKRPIVWAVKSYLPASKYEGDYVINSVVTECASVVMDAHQKTVLYKCTDNIMKYSDFETLCLQSGAAVSPAMTPVLTQHLSRSGQLARATLEDGYQVIKLSRVKDKGIKVTDMDIGILRIKDTITDLSEQVKELEQTVRGLRQLAKEKLKSKDKKEALRHLKLSSSKKSVLHSKQSMLDNVQAVLHRIQSAETDAMVFSAYKIGVEAMRSMRQDLTLEKVEDVNAEMRDLVEEGEDIAAVLSQGSNDAEAEDGELLLELERMIAQEEGPVEQEGGEGTDQLEALVAGLSVQDKERDGGVRGNEECIDQLPPVPLNKLPPVATHMPSSRTKNEPLPA